MAGRDWGSSEQARGSSGCVIAFLAVVVLGLGWVGVEAYLIIDGLDGGVTRPDFDPHAPEVARARTEAKATIEADLDVLGPRSTTLHPVGGKGMKDTCNWGQASWASVSDKAVTCKRSGVRMFTFGGPDARTSMLRIVDELAAGTCAEGEMSGARGGMEYYVSEPGKVYEAYPDGIAMGDSGGGAVECGASPYDTSGAVIVSWIAWPLPPEEREMAEYHLGPCDVLDSPDCVDEPIDLDEALVSAPAGDRWAVIVGSSLTYWTVDWE